MSSLKSHSRKDQIAINLPTDEFAMEYFKIINKKLEESYIFNRKTEGNKLTFSGSIFRFVWNGWNVFNPISAGEIEFSEEDGKTFIRHKIYFTESLLIALLFHIIPLFTYIYESMLSIFVLIAIWIFYIINYSITVFRFNSYISEMLIKVNMESGYKFKTDRIAFG